MNFKKYFSISPGIPEKQRNWSLEKQNIEVDKKEK